MTLALSLVLEAAGGNNTGFVVPDDVVAGLGAGGRPKVVVTVNGHTWRGSIARMGGRYLIGVTRANRDAAGVAAGDTLDVEIALDEAPREVEVPDDLAAALAADPAARSAWDALSYTNRKEHARSLVGAKKPETRTRRLERVLSSLA